MGELNAGLKYTGNIEAARKVGAAVAKFALEKDIKTVVFDRNGFVGYGLGKANEVPEAIRKGVEQAKKNLIKVAISEGQTIPYEIVGHFGAGRVLMMPASAGTGVIAGGAARAVFESAGVHNILAKCLGSNNPHNVVKAVFAGLENMKSPEELMARRGLAE